MQMDEQMPIIIMENASDNGNLGMQPGDEMVIITSL
jgi:hypothetical protein